jgi:hypothetical protein
MTKLTSIGEGLAESNMINVRDFNLQKIRRAKTLTGKEVLKNCELP